MSSVFSTLIMMCLIVNSWIYPVCSSFNFSNPWEVFIIYRHMNLPGGTNSKEPTCQCRRHKRHRFSPWVGKILWRRKWQPTPVSLSGESHGQRSLVGYNPWGHKESGTTEASEQVHTQNDLIQKTSSRKMKEPNVRSKTLVRKFRPQCINSNVGGGMCVFSHSVMSDSLWPHGL